METPVSEDINEQIRLHSFGERIHALILDDKKLVFDETEMSLAAVSHFKFGIRIVQFGMFPVGRRYQINLQGPESRLNLVFTTYLGMGNSYFNRLFESLVNGIWLNIGERLFQEAVDLVLAGKAFTIGNCSVGREGISLNQDSPITKKQYLIPWSEVSYEKKYNRLVINSKSNHRLWANLYFLENWNVDVLMNVLDWLFKEGGLGELENTKAME